MKIIETNVDKMLNAKPLCIQNVVNSGWVICTFFRGEEGGDIHVYVEQARGEVVREEAREKGARERTRERKRQRKQLQNSIYQLNSISQFHGTTCLTSNKRYRSYLQG